MLQTHTEFFTPYTPLASIVDFLLNVGSILLATTLHASNPHTVNLALVLAASVYVTITGRICSGGNSSNARKPLPIVAGLLLDAGVVLIAIACGSPNHVAHLLALVPLIGHIVFVKGSVVRRGEPSSVSGRVSCEAKTPEVSSWTLPINASVTTYRGTMMVITCAAILAVDFNVFPRRFAKVETWGTSLMDMGVGSFVFSAGLVGARPALKERLGGKRSASVSGLILRSIRHSTPLLVLGVIRLLSVKGLDYAEHVSEYGIHWNFFFTLACLPPFMAAFQSTLQLLPAPSLLSAPALLAIALAGAYQVVLDNTALKAFILTAPRTDLLSKNREGIFSVLGYLSIYLAGQDAGMYVLPRPRLSSSKSAATYRKRLVAGMAVKAVIWITFFILSSGLGLTVSRRLANLPYVLWVNAFNNAQLLLFCLIETAYFPGVCRTQDPDLTTKSTSTIMQAFNKNGLAVFLIANLMTGMVNLSLNTLDMGSLSAMGILIGYAACVTGAALILDKTGVKVKL